MGPVYEVDESSFDSWQRVLEVNLPTYLGATGTPAEAPTARALPPRVEPPSPHVPTVELPPPADVRGVDSTRQS